MTLARVTERIKEQNIKDRNIDGRRFSSRSLKKVKYEVFDMQRSKEKTVRRGGKSAMYGGLTREEFEEYKQIEFEIKEKKEKDQNEKIVKDIVLSIVDKICTSDKEDS